MSEKEIKRTSKSLSKFSKAFKSSKTSSEIDLETSCATMTIGFSKDLETILSIGLESNKQIKKTLKKRKKDKNNISFSENIFFSFL